MSAQRLGRRGRLPASGRRRPAARGGGNPRRRTCGSRGRRCGVGRYYDPQTGLFLTVDPLVDQTRAPYEYGQGDPVNEGDPLGLAVELGSGSGPPSPGSICIGASGTAAVASCIYHYLMAYNALPAIQAAAIVGNLEYESGYFRHITDIVCAFGACGGGLAQWGVGSAAFSELQQFGGVSGIALPPLGYQVEFLSMELYPTGAYSNPGAVNALNWMTREAEAISGSSGKLAAEVKAWEVEFERPRGTVVTPAGRENVWQNGFPAQMSFASRLAAAKAVFAVSGRTIAAVCAPSGSSSFS